MKESHLEELPVKEIQDFHVSFSNNFFSDQEKKITSILSSVIQNQKQIGSNSNSACQLQSYLGSMKADIGKTIGA